MVSEANQNIDRRPVSPVVTSPDASKHPDESRHVTSPALAALAEKLAWDLGEVVTPASIMTIKRSTVAKFLMPYLERAAAIQVSPTDGETPPPARQR